MSFSRRRVAYWAGELLEAAPVVAAAASLPAASEAIRGPFSGASALSRVIRHIRAEGGDALVNAVLAEARRARATHQLPTVRGRASRRWRRSGYADAAAVAAREAHGSLHHAEETELPICTDLADERRNQAESHLGELEARHEALRESYRALPRHAIQERHRLTQEMSQVAERIVMIRRRLGEGRKAEAEASDEGR